MEANANKEARKSVKEEDEEEEEKVDFKPAETLPKPPN